MDLTPLRKIDLFRNLDPVQLAHLASISKEQAHEYGEVLFREEDKAEELFVILEGKVRISKVAPGFGEEAFAILDAGSYFGEMEFFDGNLSRAAQATVHQACRLQVFRFEDIHALLAADGELALAFLWSMVRTLSARLRATNEKMLAMFALSQFK
jgi:CRP/FNR family cyclic AMP-dependent transcriptional regulator